MTDFSDWRPSCSLNMLQVRAVMLKAVRAYFDQCGYLEVETPCLSRDIVLDAWLEPFEIPHGGERWFLQTSPEAFMKRLLAAGSGSIFQVSRVFRRNESGSRHNPEFTMIEWYGVGSTWSEQVAMTEQLVRAACSAATTVLGRNPTDRWSNEPFAIIRYVDAFMKRFHIDVLNASAQELGFAARRHGVPLPDSCSEGSVDEIRNAMLAFGIEPSLGIRDGEGRLRPAFLCDYPPSQAALAVVSENDPKVARRFELYIDGLELCNGYQELTDLQELQRREILQNTVRTNCSFATLPGALRLAAAMSAELPACSGVALGFDRLVMIAAGVSQIGEAMPFPEKLA